MREFIKLKIFFEAQTSNGAAINGDEAQTVVNQIRDDALFGTFSSFDDEYWKAYMERAPDTLARASLEACRSINEGKVSKCEFTLEVASDLFPAAHGGGYSTL
jgi:hypothetical protein